MKINSPEVRHPQSRKVNEDKEGFKSPNVCAQNVQKFEFPSYSYYSPLHFTAMKKSQFSGFDLAFVNMLKAPIDKFNDTGDLKAFAKEKLEALLDVEQYKADKWVTEGRNGLLTQEETDALNNERMPLIEAWKKYLTQENDTYRKDPVQAYIIFSSIMKDVKPENKLCPPPLDKRALADTVEKISNTIEKNRNCQFNFCKEYKNALQILATRGYGSEDTGEAMTGWVKIPSYEHDPENFDKNVERLKILSHPGWCTKSGSAKPYLEDGDCHIYLDDGKSRISVRLDGDKVVEVQGARNNYKVPLGYFAIAKDYMLNVLKDNGYGKECIEEAEKVKEKFDAKKAEFEAKGIDVKSGSVETQKAIFEFFGFGVKTKETPEGQKLVVSSLGHPEDENFSFGDFRINENALVKDVVEVEGNAYIEGLNITSLPSLKSIGGSLGYNPGIKCYPLLENVGEGMSFIGAKNISFPALKNIGTVANFDYAENISLPALERIGGLANFRDAQNIDLSSLKLIEGGFYVFGSSLEDTDICDRVVVKGKIHTSKKAS